MKKNKKIIIILSIIFILIIAISLTIYFSISSNKKKDSSDVKTEEKLENTSSENNIEESSDDELEESQKDDDESQKEDEEEKEEPKKPENNSNAKPSTTKPSGSNTKPSNNSNSNSSSNNNTEQPTQTNTQYVKEGTYTLNGWTLVVKSGNKATVSYKGYTNNDATIIPSNDGTNKNFLVDMGSGPANDNIAFVVNSNTRYPLAIYDGKITGGSMTAASPRESYNGLSCKTSKSENTWANPCVNKITSQLQMEFSRNNPGGSIVWQEVLDKNLRTIGVIAWEVTPKTEAELEAAGNPYPGTHEAMNYKQIYFSA